MIFSIRDLSFELGSLFLEGWLAFAARVLCALLILLAAWLVRRWLTKKGFPALLARSWHFAGTPILLRTKDISVSLASPESSSVRWLLTVLFPV